MLSCFNAATELWTCANPFAVKPRSVCCLLIGLESTMPAAKGLYVDLRPLARGDPAKGFAFGSMDMAAVHTDISATNVELWGKNFADQALIDEAKRGMSDDSTVLAGTLLCAPHIGALKSFDVAMSKIEKSVTEGWASNYEALPCWPSRF